MERKKIRHAKSAPRGRGAQVFSVSALDVGEVAHGLLHGAEVGKRAGELLDDALERHDLVAVHNADEQRLVRMREAADGRDLRNTVLHMLEQLGGKLLRLIRDDLEFHDLLDYFRRRK